MLDDTDDRRFSFDAGDWYWREGERLAGVHSPIVLWIAALHAALDQDYAACPPSEELGHIISLAIERMGRWRNPGEAIERAITDLRDVMHDDPLVRRAEAQAETIFKLRWNAASLSKKHAEDGK